MSKSEPSRALVSQAARTAARSSGWTAARKASRDWTGRRQRGPEAFLALPQVLARAEQFLLGALPRQQDAVGILEGD
jgi:hypothetical protein